MTFSSTLLILSTIAIFTQQSTLPLPPTLPSPPSISTPFYAIAHRVLTAPAIGAALSHGANALETDMTAYPSGWYADHDGTPASKGDSARDLFTAIARERAQGAPITFVWLDIKNPNACDPDKEGESQCSIAGLQDLAREILEPAGVRVLYGFLNASEQAAGKAFEFIKAGLGKGEAVNVDGDPRETIKEFEIELSVAVEGRVASYGSNDLPVDFGSCREEGYYTCTELRQAVESRGFGKVFGWTSTVGQAEYVDQLLGVAQVDGLIYGFKDEDYRDDGKTEAAARDITSWLRDHPDRLHLAGRDEPPW